MAKLLPLLISTGNQDKINDPPSSLQRPPNYMHNEIAVHEAINRLAKDPNQNKELARGQVDSEVAAIRNPHLLFARLFRLNFVIAPGEREMQELFAGNTSNSNAGAS